MRRINYFRIERTIIKSKLPKTLPFREIDSIRYRNSSSKRLKNTFKKTSKKDLLLPAKYLAVLRSSS